MVVNKVRMLNRRIKEANKLKSIFTIIGCSSVISAIIGMFLIGSLTDKASMGAFVVLGIITFIFVALFIFSNIVINLCETKIETWKEIRNYIIVKTEKDKAQLEIANAFAHCYWNALDNPVPKNSKLELNFQANCLEVNRFLNGD